MTIFKENWEIISKKCKLYYKISLKFELPDNIGFIISILIISKVAQARRTNVFYFLDIVLFSLLFLSLSL
jgi:hypothetical protein